MGAGVPDLRLVIRVARHVLRRVIIALEAVREDVPGAGAAALVRVPDVQVVPDAQAAPAVPAVVPAAVPAVVVVQDAEAVAPDVLDAVVPVEVAVLGAVLPVERVVEGVPAVVVVLPVMVHAQTDVPDVADAAALVAADAPDVLLIVQVYVKTRVSLPVQPIVTAPARRRRLAL